MTVAGEEPGQVHEQGLSPGVRDQEAELRGARPHQGQGGDRLQMSSRRNVPD